MNTFFFLLHFKVNDPTNNASGGTGNANGNGVGNGNGNGSGNNGWGYIPYPVYPVHPYYPGNGKCWHIFHLFQLCIFMKTFSIQNSFLIALRNWRSNIEFCVFKQQ